MEGTALDVAYIVPKDIQPIHNMKTWNIASILILAAVVPGSFAYASVSFGQHDQNPRVISQPAPDYPYQAIKADKEGAVLVEFIVNAQGQVIDPVIVGSTDPAFEKSAIDAVKEWKFAAATYQGQPVPVPVLRLITFTNKEHASTTPTAELVQAMRMRMPLKDLAVNDPCFCDSGKPFSACHGSVPGSSAYASATFGQHDQNPRVISQPAPDYPHQAIIADKEGAVLVEFIVNAQGQVIDPVIVGSTDPAFEKAAIDAVREWKFAAAIHEGQPAPVPVLRLITFTNKEHTPTISTAELVQAMQMRMPLTDLVAHDPCFCGSGKSFNQCHGTGSLAVK